jgi:hypothetical protein
LLFQNIARAANVVGHLRGKRRAASACYRSDGAMAKGDSATAKEKARHLPGFCW